MSDGTKIEWTDATLNVVNGCTVISPGCTNCYAMRAGGRNLPGHPSTGLTQPSKAGHVWTGEVRFNQTALLQPLGWKRPRRIFWNAHGDLFHESVPIAWIDKVFAVCALTPQHSHQILTKRSARMREYMNDPAVVGRVAAIAAEIVPDGRDTYETGLRFVPGSGFGFASWPLTNVWLGVSVEDQRRADERVPDLLATPAAVRFISGEPLLGPIALTHIDLRKFGDRPTDLSNRLGDYVQPLRGNFTDSPKINWVIVGGESGPGARPMHPDWARSLRDQCAAAGVPMLFKQWGEWTPGDNAESTLDRRTVDTATWFDERWSFETVRGDFNFHSDDEPDMYRAGKKASGRKLDGVQHDGMPA
ncbi:phage Gp37/Gp68 family protein [Sphingomonas sp. RB3P16]|uniref:phage Gp37/Gp68 family protein n=1 Tax=Parasphingomonas frigoris TaxID=3096163 RepID=UPI002FC98304